MKLWYELAKKCLFHTTFDNGTWFAGSAICFFNCFVWSLFGVFLGAKSVKDKR